MGVDAQGNIGLCVPQALGNCYDIHAGINELAGVRAGTSRLKREMEARKASKFRAVTP